MYNSIINPNTGRKCSINSKLGRKILQRYINELQEGGSAWTKYGTKGRHLAANKRIQAAMIALGVWKNGRYGPVAALDLLKDIVGKNKATATKNGFKYTWSEHLKSIPKAELLADILEQRVIASKAAVEPVKKFLTIADVPLIEEADVAEAEVAHKEEGGPEVLYIEDIQEGQEMIADLHEAAQEDDEGRSRETTVSPEKILAIVDMVSKNPALKANPEQTPEQIEALKHAHLMKIKAAAPALAETVDLLIETDMMDEIEPVAKVAAGNVKVTKNWYCVAPYMPSAGKKARVKSCKKLLDTPEDCNADHCSVGYNGRQLCMDKCMQR